jgi:hypothetical protein
MPVAPGPGTNRAGIGFAEIAAQTTMTDSFDRIGQCTRQTQSAFTFTLKYLIGHSLCSLLTDARKYSKSVDQLLQ